VIEIRWHGRAGQGAKTASLLLASAAMAEGRDVQAFPEYGPERSGAPMRAYTRIDTRKIRRRYGITEPDVVVVLDESLLQEANPTEGLRDGGLLIVNSERDLDGAICIPASRIAAQGAGFVNVVMLGAVSAALGEPALEAVLAAARAKGVAVDDVEAGFRSVEELRCAA
jgi:pyruvate ferredoxin oxidoreductase gamma subunit